MNRSAGRWPLLLLILLIALALGLLLRSLWRLGRVVATPTPRPTDAPLTPHAVVPTAVPPPVPSTPTALPTATARSTPTPFPSPEPTATPLPAVVGYAVHRVVAGETLEQIAVRYGSLPQAIAGLNRFPPEEMPAEGRPLVIPLLEGLEPTAPVTVSGYEVERGLPGRRVALTFDAGASAEPAGRILDALRKAGVRVTFFLTGRFVEENPDLVRRMAAEGHEFGNHTYSHPDLTGLTDEAVRQELARTEQVIRDLTGQGTRPFLRPPFGARNRHLLNLLAGEGYISIYWTVDSWDSVGEPKTPEFLLERVTHPTDGSGRPVSLEGAIVLMHVGSEPTAQALPEILAWFRAEGWEVVPVSEVLRPAQGSP